MSLLDDMAEKLAHDTIKAMQETGNDRLWVDVSNYIGTSSPSLQEAFNAACRVFLAEERGRKYLESLIEKTKVGA